MRPILALMISTVILGSVWTYLKSQSPRATSKAEPVLQPVEGQFDVEITLTFAAGPDAYALRETDAPSLIVEHLGHAILNRTDQIAAGASVLVEGVPHIERGKNSFFVRCTPREPDAEMARALRMRVLRDGIPVADSTLWSAPGAPCEGIVEVDIQE